MWPERENDDQVRVASVRVIVTLTNGARDVLEIPAGELTDHLSTTLDRHSFIDTSRPPGDALEVMTCTIKADLRPGIEPAYTLHRIEPDGTVVDVGADLRARGV